MSTLTFDSTIDRDLAIAEMRTGGATFRAIAAAVGLSENRVRNICEERKRAAAREVRYTRLIEALESSPLGQQFLKDRLDATVAEVGHA